MINIVLFSKDRPLQASACLRSLFYFFKEANKASVTVIYKASSEAFRGAYEALQATQIQNTNISFREETTALRALVNESLAKGLHKPYTMFLVDDILFRDHFSLVTSKDKMKFLSTPSVLNLSLRLDKNINHCYATNRSQRIPNMVKGCVWDWTMAEGDWGYPMSVDGNIFKTEVITPIVNSIGFNNPNEFEAALDSYAKFRLAAISPLMMCFDEKSKLLNVPANRVQNNVNNRVENSYSAEFLLEKFNEGYEIDFMSASAANNTSCHWPMEYKFRKLK